MKLSELRAKFASIGFDFDLSYTDNYGQIVIYTDMMFGNDEKDPEIVPFDDANCLGEEDTIEKGD